MDHADWEISGGRGRGSDRDRLGRRPRRAPGGGRRRRVPRGEIQRQSILDALERLLGEIPVMEISVKDITEAAGIKRPNFYFYFESKDEVLSELVSTVWREWDEAIGSYHRLAGESHADYFDRLFVVSHSVWVRRSRVIVAGLQATGYDRTLRAKWDALDDELNRQLAEQMDRDVAAGHRRQNRSAP
ncbi:MAG TPA: TetR/AcrR family transcriptional regulator [Candidatus Dietzia intestinigallinarum]|nr:TetR/AcrR family transcriptional regulator [Candidatus Dietzia intestinigallinarum]